MKLKRQPRGIGWLFYILKTILLPTRHEFTGQDIFALPWPNSLQWWISTLAMSSGMPHGTAHGLHSHDTSDVSNTRSGSYPTTDAIWSAAPLWLEASRCRASWRAPASQRKSGVSRGGIEKDPSLATHMPQPVPHVASKLLKSTWLSHVSLESWPWNLFFRGTEM